MTRPWFQGVVVSRTILNHLLYSALDDRWFRTMDINDRQEPSGDTAECGWTELRHRADGGDAQAQFGLGLYYSSTESNTSGFAEAARWYRKAADQDYALAQFNLGVMFARGQGMPQDDVVAADWMRRAGEGGDAGGQHNLGLRCQGAGADSPSDDATESRIEALKWFQLAAAQGYDGSLAARQSLILTMTRAEVEEGRKRASDFVVREPIDSKRP